MLLLCAWVELLPFLLFPPLQDSGYVIAHYLQVACTKYQQQEWTSYFCSLLYISGQANVCNCVFYLS